MKLAVYSKEGKETGRTIDLSAGIFGLETPNDHAIWQDVRNIQANARQGTHNSKGRGDVSGSTKKPFKQKGTGGARAGHKRSPLWRHGGTVFGPEPRDYGYRMNRKEKELARKSALTYKAREESIRLVENFTMDSPKTQEFLKVLANLSMAGKKVLFVVGADSKNIYLSGRNIQKAKISRAEDINTLDILHADNLVITEDAMKVIEKNLGGAKS